MKFEWFSTAIAILYIYNFIFDSIAYIKAGNSVKDKKQEKSTQKSSANHRPLDIIVFALSALIYLVLIACVTWTNVLPKIIVILIIIIPSWIIYVNSFVKASESIKYIVLGSDSNNNLSVNEKYNFDIISGTVLLIYSFFVSGKVENYISGLSLSHTVTGTLITGYSAIVMFGLSFSVIIQLILPIKHLKKLIEFISNKSKKLIKKLTSKLYYMVFEGTIVKARFSNHVIDSKLNSKILIKVLIYASILPFSFILDVFIGLILCIFCYGICGGIIIAYELLSYIGKVIFCLVSMVSKSPERRIVKNTFRLSFIISVIFVVITNRYGWFYEYDEVFLSVSEFLASTIVIPVIFEWIYSNEKDKTDKQSQIKVPPQANCLKNSQKKNNKKKPNHTPWRKSKKK